MEILFSGAIGYAIGYYGFMNIVNLSANKIKELWKKYKDIK